MADMQMKALETTPGAGFAARTMPPVQVLAAHGVGTSAARCDSSEGPCRLSSLKGADRDPVRPGRVHGLGVRRLPDFSLGRRIHGSSLQNAK